MSIRERMQLLARLNAIWQLLVLGDQEAAKAGLRAEIDRLSK